MAKLYFALAAIFFVGLTSANPTTTSSNTITELGDQLGTALNTLGSRFFEFVGVQNKEELTEKVVNEGKTLGNSLEGLLNEFTTKAKSASGTLEGPAQDFSNKLQEVVKKLTEENPELVAEGKKVTDNIQTELNSVYTLTNEFTKNVAQESGPAREELNAVLKKILETTKNAVTDISSTVESAAKH